MMNITIFTNGMGGGEGGVGGCGPGMGGFFFYILLYYFINVMTKTYISTQQFHYCFRYIFYT